MDPEVVEESQKTRRARKKLERRLKQRERLADNKSLERQKGQIAKWLERHESERVDLESTEPADPGDEIEAFLDHLKKREIGF